MTDAEKVAAFDALARTFTCQTSDGQWHWQNPCPCGGPFRATQPEAVADLVAFAGRYKPKVYRLGVPDEQAEVADARPPA